MGKRDIGQDQMLEQGIRSRYGKATRAIDAADALIDTEGEGLGGTSADLRSALMQLQVATTNLTELLVYRKIYGID